MSNHEPRYLSDGRERRRPGIPPVVLALAAVWGALLGLVAVVLWRLWS